MWVVDVVQPDAPRDVIARRESAAARLLPRIAVARCAGVPVEEVTVLRRCAVCGRTGHGRPYIVNRTADGVPLDCSVAHSAGLVLVAVTAGGLVGVDVEARDRLPDVAAVARLVCSGPEQALLDRCAEADRLRLFLRLWVRKEAVLKLLGLGVTGPWRAVDARADVVLPARPRRGRVVPIEPLHLTDLALRDGPGGAAADGRPAVAALATTVPLTAVRWATTAPVREGRSPGPAVPPAA